jgi:hypothetical protein
VVWVLLGCCCGCGFIWFFGGGLSGVVFRVLCLALCCGVGFVEVILCLVKAFMIYLFFYGNPEYNSHTQGKNQRHKDNRSAKFK